MKERLTNTTLREFLTDFENRSETIILEEGKEKSDLQKIAEARGIQIKNSKDLVSISQNYEYLLYMPLQIKQMIMAQFFLKKIY